MTVEELDGRLSSLDGQSALRADTYLGRLHCVHDIVADTASDDEQTVSVPLVILQASHTANPLPVEDVRDRMRTMDREGLVYMDTGENLLLTVQDVRLAGDLAVVPTPIPD